MLLRHTPKEVTERKALTINPAKTCQPIGAMYAALGIHGCLPHSHGSQGCCSYHRSTLTRHYKEPVMAATSSFTEGSSVFGGQANLLQAIDNIFTIYDPDVIAVHTTCLSETIGDDIPQIIAKARGGRQDPGGQVRHPRATRPSYVGSHVTGFANMVKAMVDYFAEPTGEQERQRSTSSPAGSSRADMRGDQAPGGRGRRRHRSCSPTPPTCSTARSDRQVRVCIPKGGATVDDLKGAGASHRHPGPGRRGARPRPPGCSTPSARCPAGSSTCPSACGPPTASSTPCGRSAGRRCPSEIIRRARPAARPDHRHAPVLLRQEGGPGGRSRPARSP